MPIRLDHRQPGFDGQFRDFLATRRGDSPRVTEAVAAIVQDVRSRGDAAVIEYTRRFDDFDAPHGLSAVHPDEIDAACRQCDSAARDALSLAAARIREFHARQVPHDFDDIDGVGVRWGWRWTPLDAVGIYVPGGTAAYPSSVLMNAIPAGVAGVKRIAMVVPTPGGRLNPLVLLAASLADVTEIWRIGGAQAVAALAFGTETIAPVDKIVGPGNAYVAEAKRQVFGTVGIDMIAGPSEVLVIADDTNDPRWIAADLLAQAEHDAAAQSILLTDSEEFAGAVCQAVDEHLASLSRSTIAAESWRAHGCIIVVDSLDDAPPLVDRIAPEHLQIATDDPDALARHVHHAGSIFLGRLTAEAIGDYIGGPNHVLPTGRSARFSSGLGVMDFMKRTTFLACTDEGLSALGPAAVALAEAEGLSAHGRSVALRLNRRR